MFRHPASVVSAALLILGALTIMWGCERTPPSPTTAPTTAAISNRFGLYLASADPERGYHAATVQIHSRAVYIAPTAALTSADVLKVQLQADPQGRPEISIDFTAAGTRRLAELTRKNVHKQLAIVVDNQVLLAPKIESEVTEGHLLLTGAFTRQEFERLAQAISPGS